MIVILCACIWKIIFTKDIHLGGFFFYLFQVAQGVLTLSVTISSSPKVWYGWGLWIVSNLLCFHFFVLYMYVVLKAPSKRGRSHIMFIVCLTIFEVLTSDVSLGGDSISIPRMHECI